MYNKVFLIGNLGRDPEVRTTPSGQPVASFSIATNRKWKGRDGERKEETEWHNIVCWARLAEIAGQYLTKGRRIFVEGRIQTRSWDDQASGEKKYKTEIICENFQMLGGRGGGDSDSGGGGDYDSGGGSGGGSSYGGGGSGYGGGGGGQGQGGGGGYGGGDSGGGDGGGDSGGGGGADDDDIPF